jgi:hypothetical protein
MISKFINKKIQDTLHAKEIAFSREKHFHYGEDNPSANSYRGIESIASRTPFFRMISNKKSVKNIVIAGGLRNEDGSMKHGFGDGEKGLYYETTYRDIVTGRVGDSKEGIRPIAGIKDVEISYAGDFKALRKATINWSVGSLAELEILTPYFLTVGKTVMIDWGWVTPTHGGMTHNSKYQSLQQQFGVLYYNEVEGKVDPAVFTDQQSKILNIGGNYGAMGGTISNFSYDLRKDGGFDCVTKVTAIGANMFKKPVDKGISDKSIITKKDSADKNKPIVTPIDSLVGTVLNLKQYIVDNCFAEILTEEILDEEGSYLQPGSAGYDRLTSIAMDAVKNNRDVSGRGKSVLQRQALKYFTPRDGYTLVSRIGTAANTYNALWTDETQNILWLAGDYSKINSSDCQVPISDAGEMWVSWGWFEDNVINRYTSYVGDETNVTLTLRSLETLIDERGGGVPVETTDADKAMTALYSQIDPEMMNFMLPPKKEKLLKREVQKMNLLEHTKH